MEVQSLEIFDKHIFGSDVDNWLKLCKEQKREWILKCTNQRNESLINEFINNPKISKDCKCLDCGKKKQDEPNGVSKEVANFIEPDNNSGDNGKDNTKRPSGTKKGKG